MNVIEDLEVEGRCCRYRAVAAVDEHRLVGDRRIDLQVPGQVKQGLLHFGDAPRGAAGLKVVPVSGSLRMLSSTLSPANRGDWNCRAMAPPPL